MPNTIKHAWCCCCCGCNIHSGGKKKNTSSFKQSQIFSGKIVTFCVFSKVCGRIRQTITCWKTCLFIAHKKKKQQKNYFKFLYFKPKLYLCTLWFWAVMQFFSFQTSCMVKAVFAHQCSLNWINGSDYCLQWTVIVNNPPCKIDSYCRLFLPAAIRLQPHTIKRITLTAVHFYTGENVGSCKSNCQ